MYVYDPVLAFLGGDPETTAGIGANIAGGMLIVGDVGSLVKNAWRSMGWSSKEPSYLEASLSGLGILTEFAVGAGEVADLPISIARAIVARLGEGPFTQTVVGRIRGAVTSGVPIRPAERAFLTALKDSDELLQVFSTVCKSDELLEAAVRAADRIGPQFYLLVKQIYGIVAAAQCPAERFEVHMHFRLLDVGGLDTIRAMCGPEDEVFTRICSFDLPDDNWGELTAHTTANGHRLNLTLRMPEGLPLVAQMLGLPFESA